MSILLKNVLLDGARRDVFILGNRFSSILPAGEYEGGADEVLDCSRKALLPPFYNAHTHAAMSLLRGWADDLPLKEWLEEHIWPREDSLTPEDIYNGTRLAILEMIKTGTVFFSDMYFDVPETIRAIEEMGVRAAVGVTVMDNHSKALCEEKMEFVRTWTDPTGGRIQLTMAPHAIYTVGKERLEWSAAFARENGIRIHIHLSETEGEVRDCLREHGMSPVAYLDSLGFLGEDVVIAHGVHCSPEDIAILEKRGVGVVNCPCSNAKLSSGIFPYRNFLSSGCRLALGTDGCSSNNNLDMREEMKTASLLAKAVGSPVDLPAARALEMATRGGAQVFGIDAGVIEEGKLADGILVNLDNVKMTPCHNLVSNWVYSADSSCIDTVICDGRILMREGKVKGEEEILAAVRAL